MGIFAAATEHAVSDVGDDAVKTDDDGDTS